MADELSEEHVSEMNRMAQVIALQQELLELEQIKMRKWLILNRAADVMTGVVFVFGMIAVVTILNRFDGTIGE